MCDDDATAADACTLQPAGDEEVWKMCCVMRVCCHKWMLKEPSITPGID